MSIPFKFGELLGNPVVPFQAFADSCRGGMSRDTYNACHTSAAPSGSSRLHSSTKGAEINKQLRLLFATALTLTFRHSDVIVV